jgi:TMEM175 potassium channel family protein
MSEPMPPTQQWWDTNRVEAFSDGVMAVVITIMAFELKRPSTPTWHALTQSFSALLVYILSFVMIGIYWNNHHHLFRATERISGAVMWANLFLLFWLSLLPFVTYWVSTFYKAHLPASIYGVVALGAAVAYGVLVRTIIQANGKESAVATAVGSDLKGNISVALYAAGVGLAWVSPWIAYGLYIAVAVVWFVPDRRFTRAEA